MSEVARDAQTAWRKFQDLGGMELKGRDADLEEGLRRRLAPLAPDFHSALEAATPDALVRALFEVVSPFAEMFRDIVAFFRAAGAAQGREQWEIRIEDEHLDLSDFQRFQAGLECAEVVLDLPALDGHSAWLVQQTAGASSMAARLSPGLEDARPTGDPEIDEWLRAYGKGEYPPYPTKLRPGTAPPGFTDAAGVVWAAVERVRATWGDRSEMMRAYHAHDARGRRLLRPDVTGDALDPANVAQNETDFWIRSATVILGRALQASASDRAAIEASWAADFARFGRRSWLMSADAALLERILSLPVWRRRHELYAVWIATQIVAALPDHTVELHHDEGRIVFAFKSTVVADIPTSRPPMRLFAERRSPLVEPEGEGRKGNVQPDYSLWAAAGEAERCPLVVEVKHYKSAARRRFSQVLTDYARAHPDATIVLVNHGPVADMLDDADPALVARCAQFGGLTASNVAGRAALTDLIRKIVGHPASATCEPTAVLVDVSLSMRSALGSVSFEDWLETGDVIGSAVVALADSELRGRCAPSEALASIRKTMLGGSTDLAQPAAALLGEFGRLLVATDSGGLADLDRSGLSVVNRVSQPNGWWLATVER